MTVAPIIGLLGPVAVADQNGQMRPVQGIRARRLLAVLALMPGTHRSQAALIDGVWGDDLPRSPQSALHLSLIHISEPTRRYAISYAVFCLKKKRGLSLIHI